MHRMVDTIRTIARDEAELRWAPAYGVVTSVHGRNGQAEHACTVKLRETGMVLPKVPLATGLIGLAALPRQDDLVLVVFAGGDLHAPVVVGRLYNEKVKPPKHDAGEVVAWLPGGEEEDDKKLQLKVTTPGDGTRKVELILDGDVPVTLTVDDSSIKLATKDASLALTQTSSSDAKAELTVGKCSLVLDQGGDVTLTADGKLTLEASDIELSGDTSVKVAGQKVELN